MDLEKNKQRLEILAAEVEELKNSGGGETVDAYTKEEADDKFAEKATTYTKTEVNEAIAAAGGGDVIVDGDNVKTKNAGLGKGILIGNQAGFNSTANYSSQIAIGTRAGIINPSGEDPIAIGYQASGKGSDIVIGSNSTTNNGTGNENTLVGHRIDARGSNGVGIGYSAHVGDYGVSIGWSSGGIYSQNGVYVGFGCQTKLPSENSRCQIAIGGNVKASGNYAMGLGQFLKVNTQQTILGKYNVESNEQNYFAVGNGTSQTRSNLFSFSNNLFYCGNDTTGYDLRYFAPADETLTNGGTISATALANALKHVPLSFNAHMCYYSYEDNDNVYYVSIRFKGDALHTKVLHINVIAINKKTGVATFNEFDRS